MKHCCAAALTQAPLADCSPAALEERAFPAASLTSGFVPDPRIRPPSSAEPAVAVCATQRLGARVPASARTKEITIKHGPIPHLAMGPMTMAFPVKDPAMLVAVKAGDKVRFVAEKVGDEAVITKIELAR